MAIERVKTGIRNKVTLAFLSEKQKPRENAGFNHEFGRLAVRGFSERIYLSRKTGFSLYKNKKVFFLHPKVF